MSAWRVSTASAPFSREPILREIGGRAGFPPAPALSAAASPGWCSRPAAPAPSAGRASSPPFLSARRSGFASASFAAS
eukprot:2527836-Pleurochrysis_carterae.AAC.1